ncbi:MAG: hypothetical protein ACTSV2_15950 [Candidatus Thorarchaeota archaeon]
MKIKRIVPMCFFMVLFMLPLFVSAYSNSDSPTYAYGEEDTLGTGEKNAAAVESTGECRCYVNSIWFQTVAVAGLFGSDDAAGTRTWTVAIDAELQAYMTRYAGYATITIQVVILDEDYDLIEALTVWVRDCVLINPQEFDGTEIVQSDTFAATDEARYFGVWFYTSVSWGATICQDSEHTGSGYPAVLTVNSITWSY